MRTAIPLSLALLVGCADHSPGDGRDSEGSDTDGGPDVPILAANLGVELAEVGSFVVQTPNTARARVDGSFRAGEDGPQLFALTLDGEAIEVDLVEGGTMGGYGPPSIRNVHALSGWVLFETWGYSVYSIEGETTVEIPCATIAARRSDGALFCSELGIRASGDGYGNRDPGVESALANATGDLLYIAAIDDLGADIIYRVSAPDLDSLTATLIEPIWRPNWRAVNATGDLLVDHLPAGVTPPDSVTEIYPSDGAPAIAIPTVATGFNHRFGIAGERGSPEQDDFFLLEVANDPTQSRLRVLGKQADGFEVSEHPVGLEPGCGFLHHLADGTYALCNGSIARVIEDGVVLAEPVHVALDGLAVQQVGGLGFRFADRMLVFVVDDGTSLAFLRHDGVEAQVIPFGELVELLGFSVSRAGDIDFIGVTIDTHERVIGVVPAGADAVEILSHDAIDPSSVVAFAPIH